MAYDSVIPAMLSGLPDLLIGIVVMLVLSASMSTLSSLVLTSSSTLALDFIKGNLIKKALGVDALPIEIQDDRVTFPWFEELPDSDAVQAYTHFLSALCEMSKNAKRVTVTVKAVENEKYAFRCFLLRLGFIGAEYKTERKILLKNLTGSSAFKSGAKKEVPGDEISK